MREVCQGQLETALSGQASVSSYDQTENSSECLMNETILLKLSSPVSQAEEGMSPSTIPFRDASLLHSSLSAW